jgi:CheY-like chemotaxis protein
MKLFFLITCFALCGFSEVTQLSVIIKQNEEQIRQIQELLEKSKLSIAEARSARELLQQLTTGLDRSLDLMSRSKDYAEIIQHLQIKDNFRNLSFPAENSSKHLEQVSKGLKTPLFSKQDLTDFKSFQQNIALANDADIKAIGGVETLTDKATPYDLQRISTSSALAQWKAVVRLSAQLAEMVSELRSLREEVLAQRVKEEAAQEKEKAWLSEAINGATQKP